MSTSPIILEQEYNADINTVWSAITEKQLMQKWFFNILDFKADVGYTFRFEGGEGNNRYVHICEILEIVHEEKLSYSWEYEGEVGKSTVSFELSPVGKKAKVIFVHDGVESFTNPDFIKDKFIEGWEYLIRISLKEFLEHGKALRYW